MEAEQGPGERIKAQYALLMCIYKVVLIRKPLFKVNVYSSSYIHACSNVQVLAMHVSEGIVITNVFL